MISEPTTARRVFAVAYELNVQELFKGLLFKAELLSA